LSVFRSNKEIYAQLIDVNGVTILAVKRKEIGKGTNVDATAAGSAESVKGWIEVVTSIEEVTYITVDK
jgi:ribosomal protein L18